MRFLKILALVGAVTGGLWAAGTPASASPIPQNLPTAAEAVAQSTGEAYMRRRHYRRYYAPRRVYYAPRRAHRRVYYRPYPYYRPYYRPRVVCRVQYGYYGPRRVCFRR